MERTHVLRVVEYVCKVLEHTCNNDADALRTIDGATGSEVDNLLMETIDQKGAIHPRKPLQALDAGDLGCLVRVAFDIAFRTHGIDDGHIAIPYNSDDDQRLLFYVCIGDAAWGVAADCGALCVRRTPRLINSRWCAVCGNTCELMCGVSDDERDELEREDDIPVAHRLARRYMTMIHHMVYATSYVQ